MKYIKYTFIALFLALAAACSNDDPDYDHSIFDSSAPLRTEFDNWLLKNYTMPYNIEFNYLYNDKLSDNSYNVVPATIENSLALAKLIKHVWLDAYTEVVGDTFVKENSFRVFQLIGSPEYDSQASIVLGTAEGGIQVTLFRVNELDLNNIYVNQEDFYRSHDELPLDLNYWYFHTMHHEFCHILTQTKDYSTDFQTITPKYHSRDWVNVDDKGQAIHEGFITGYASSEYNEDFAEMYAVYVTSSDEEWNQILDQAWVAKYADDDQYQKNPIPVLDADGEKDYSPRELILAKLDIVRTYFANSWGIDLDDLRKVVLRRSNEASFLDLTTLN